MVLRIIAGLLLAASMLRAEERRVRLGEREIAASEVFYEDFSRGLERWLPEGDARVAVREGWLEVDCREGKVAAATIWCREEFSAAQLVEYDLRLMGESLQSNANIFLLAAHPRGLLETTAERDGRYDQYHTFPNYLVTILNATGPEKREQLRVRLRLNPGFDQQAESWHEPLRFGQVYHVAYLLEPPRVTVFLDGREIGRAEFAEKLERGCHGLRSWHTHALYDNFRVSRVLGR